MIISTNSIINAVEIKGPDFDKKNGFINYGLWLPYEPIAGSSDYLAAFIKYLFDSIVIVLLRYDVQEKDIRKVQETIENEVLNNPEYTISPD